MMISLYGCSTVRQLDGAAASYSCGALSVLLDKYVDIKLMSFMSNRKIITPKTAGAVAEACLCLHIQRAARVLARHFDDVFRPLEVTSGQYSLMMSLNRPAPSMGDTADFLAMDRTTLTAALKPLERRGLVRVVADGKDRRIRRLSLTPAGNALLAKAYALWRKHHGAIEAGMASPGADAMRGGLISMVEGLERENAG
jgi:DNA-binding MarR family transcriptional regulator